MLQMSAGIGDPVLFEQDFGHLDAGSNAARSEVDGGRETGERLIGLSGLEQDPAMIQAGFGMVGQFLFQALVDIEGVIEAPGSRQGYPDVIDRFGTSRRISRAGPSGRTLQDPKRFGRLPDSQKG